MADVEKIIVGSGKLYIAELTNGTIPSTIVSDGNCVGDISGGATLTYKPTIKDIENDFGETRRAYIDTEEVSLKSGIMTWDLSNLEKCCVGATYDSETDTITIGGKSSIKQYGVAFVHEEEDFKVTITLKGYNKNGFSLSFKKGDKATTDVEFKATSDTDGVLVHVKEEEI